MGGQLRAWLTCAAVVYIAETFLAQDTGIKDTVGKDVVNILGGVKWGLAAADRTVKDVLNSTAHPLGGDEVLAQAAAVAVRNAASTPSR